jgi:hypothetical protein
VPVLSLVWLRLVLLWLWPRPVVGALIPGLAVLFMLALATRLGWFGYPADVLAWLQGTRLPGLSAAAGTGACQGRCGYLAVSLVGRHYGWRSLTARRR